MSKKEKKTIPAEQLELYEKLVKSIPELEINSTFGFPYTSLNGHMFSLLSKSGFVGIRLPKQEREAFLEQYNSTIYKPEPGPLLKEYVTVPNDLLADVETLKSYLLISLAYVKTLKPKPPKKKK
ncbi:hypothetical protein QQ020_22910 [Fulvivirgaceae bacterium BMA12]|uniref:TfoX N-terminal domain-containing protein n=1 Tax=Agaribacillus aureus TaxID=3051825 RepID=A0ABT8LB08_9BACT|nr:hypothetical protein [Fulvivirgaceae bacterium BMA12]